MKYEKQNQFTSFTQLLSKIDVSNLGEHQIRLIKQQHNYLEKLRQQRIKIEELKRKHEKLEIKLEQQIEVNIKLNQHLEQKSRIIEKLEESLDMEIERREGMEKNMQRLIDQDKGKIKTQIRQLEAENMELKKQLKQKSILIVSLEDEHARQVKNLKDGFSIEKRSLIAEFDVQTKEVKNQQNSQEVGELRALVSRQNKALKMQNQKYELLREENIELSDRLVEAQQAIGMKSREAEQYRERVGELNDQLWQLQAKLEEQDESHKLNGQLQNIRLKMKQLQNGEIERIEFIVNQMD